MLTAAWAGAALSWFHLEIVEPGPARAAGADDALRGNPHSVLLGRVGRRLLEEVTVPDRLLITEGIDLPSVWPGDPRDAMARSFWLMTKAIVGEGEAHPDFAVATTSRRSSRRLPCSCEGGGWVRPADL